MRILSFQESLFMPHLSTPQPSSGLKIKFQIPMHLFSQQQHFSLYTDTAVTDLFGH
jgi:hypothetical protein